MGRRDLNRPGRETDLLPRSSKIGVRSVVTSVEDTRKDKVKQRTSEGGKPNRSPDGRKLKVDIRPTYLPKHFIYHIRNEQRNIRDRVEPGHLSKDFDRYDLRLDIK